MTGPLPISGLHDVKLQVADLAARRACMSSCSA
jgi:hypothetical protein